MHFANVVNQGIPREKLYPGFYLQEETAIAAAATTTTKTMAREVMEKTERGGGTLKAVEDQVSTVMYLVMPSYAEPFKTEIKQILLKEKNTLCSIKTYKKVFENIEFNIAFSNSKNIKQLIVRTKV